jgi:hypothetical protein
MWVLIVTPSLVRFSWKSVNQVSLESRSPTLAVDIALYIHMHHVRIDIIDKRIAGLGYERIDFLQLVHTRDTGRRKVQVKAGSGSALGMPLLIIQLSATIGLCVISEVVSTEVAYEASPVSTESSSDAVSAIGSVRGAAVLSNSAAGGSSLTCSTFRKAAPH